MSIRSDVGEAGHYTMAKLGHALMINEADSDGDGQIHCQVFS